MIVTKSVSKSKDDGNDSVALVARLSGVHDRSLPLAHCGETVSYTHLTLPTKRIV